MLNRILSRFRRKHNSQPVRASRYLVSDARPKTLDDIINANLAAGRLTWGW